MTNVEGPLPQDEFAEVRSVYDTHRDVRMHMKYYGSRLASYQRRNLAMEVGIALGTSATLLALPIWNTGFGKVVIATLALIAAVLGVLKPILNWSKKIEHYSKLWAADSLSPPTPSFDDPRPVRSPPRCSP